MYNEESKNFKVILGGGRGGFRNQNVNDEEGHKGHRLDDRDLIEEWKIERSKKGRAKFVHDRDGLRSVDIASTDYVLGLFEPSHMKFNLDYVNRKSEVEKPSLAEMTITAIKMLQKEENGFFLFVEGGMIDQAHHYNYAQYSLDETKEFSKAIEAARNMTDESDTLVVVTADHSHVFTYNGYADRGENIFGTADKSDIDQLPYTTLSYANGPGFVNTFFPNGNRINPQLFDYTNPGLQHPSMVPLEKDTHGGDDVGVWASGPKAHLFRGSYEQNAIPLIMAHIMQIGPYAVDEKSCSLSIQPFVVLLAALLFVQKVFR